MKPDISLRHEEVYDTNGALLGSEFTARIHTEELTGLLLYTADSFQELSEAFQPGNILATIANSDYLTVAESEIVAEEIRYTEGVRVGEKEIPLSELVVEEGA